MTFSVYQFSVAQGLKGRKFWNGSRKMMNNNNMMNNTNECPPSPLPYPNRKVECSRCGWDNSERNQNNGSHSPSNCPRHINNTPVNTNTKQHKQPPQGPLPSSPSFPSNDWHPRQQQLQQHFPSRGRGGSEPSVIEERMENDDHDITPTSPLVSNDDGRGRNRKESTTSSGSSGRGTRANSLMMEDSITNDDEDPIHSSNTSPFFGAMLPGSMIQPSSIMSPPTPVASFIGSASPSLSSFSLSSSSMSSSMNPSSLSVDHSSSSYSLTVTVGSHGVLDDIRGMSSMPRNRRKSSPHHRATSAAQFNVSSLSSSNPLNIESQSPDRRLMIHYLPDVLLEAIMSWLNYRDASKCSRVSCHWHHIALSDGVWKPILLTNWSVTTANAVRIVNAPPSRRVKLSPKFPNTNTMNNQAMQSNYPNHHVSSSDKVANGSTSLTVNPNSGGVDWRSRYRHLLRITRNWKSGQYVESLLVGHNGRVNAVSCGADIVVSCSEDQTIRVWHSPSKNCLQTLRGHSAPVTDVRFDGKVTPITTAMRNEDGCPLVPTEQEVVSASQDGSVRVWSIATGEELRHLSSTDHRSSLAIAAGALQAGWSDGVRRLKCNPTRIIAGGFQGQLLIWNRVNGQPIRCVLTPYPPVYSHPPSPLQGSSAPIQPPQPATANDRPPIECIDIESDIMAVGVNDAVFIWDTNILFAGLTLDEPLSAGAATKPHHSEMVTPKSLFSPSALVHHNSSGESSSSLSPRGTGNNYTNPEGLLLTLWHPGVRTVRLLRQSLRRVVTLGGTHVHVFCIMSGQLLQSMLIRNHGFIHQHVTPPSFNQWQSLIPLSGTNLDRQQCAQVAANWSVQTFDRFVLENPESEADSNDLSHVRVWRAFGPGLTEGEALKILVSRHHAKCSNAEVLVVADRRDGVLTLRDYVPQSIVNEEDNYDDHPFGLWHCLKLCRCNIL